MEMEHEDFYLLMMDALDGELTAVAEQELDTHLALCHDCRREWQALVTVDTLLRRTPALAPAADFAERTLARIPSQRSRMWLLGTIYFLFLLGGIIPLILGGVGLVLLRPLFNQPSTLQTIGQSLVSTLSVIGTLAWAVVQVAGELLAQQPAIVGSVLVMVGIVSVWGGVYQQLVTRPQRIS